MTGAPARRVTSGHLTNRELRRRAIADNPSPADRDRRFCARQTRRAGIADRPPQRLYHSFRAVRKRRGSAKATVHGRQGIISPGLDTAGRFARSFLGGATYQSALAAAERVGGGAKAHSGTVRAA